MPVRASCRGGDRRRAGERLEESKGEGGGEQGRGLRNRGSPLVCLTFLTQASVQLTVIHRFLVA